MRKKLRIFTVQLLAAALSAMCLLPAAAENPDHRTDAELQESVVTREGEGNGTLAENLEQLVVLLTREDVRSLMKIEDVGVITNEVIFRVRINLVLGSFISGKPYRNALIIKSVHGCVCGIFDILYPGKYRILPLKTRVSLCGFI